MLKASLLKWRTLYGMILFSLTSDGSSGSMWVERFRNKKKPVGPITEEILSSPFFVSTNNVTYDIVVIPGGLLSEAIRTTFSIRQFASQKKLKIPPLEVACLIRKHLHMRDIRKMGLISIATFHEPVLDSEGNLCLLGTGERGLHIFSGGPHVDWLRQIGFAFLAESQP